MGSIYGHLKKVNIDTAKVENDHGIKFDGSEITCFEFAVNDMDLIWIGSVGGRVLGYDVVKKCDLVRFAVGEGSVERVLEILVCGNDNFLFVRSSCGVG